jgi:hypothetical protein
MAVFPIEDEIARKVLGEVPVIYPPEMHVTTQGGATTIQAYKFWYYAAVQAYVSVPVTTYEQDRYRREMFIAAIANLYQTLIGQDVRGEGRKVVVFRALDTAGTDTLYAGLLAPYRTLADAVAAGSYQQEIWSTHEGPDGAAWVRAPFMLPQFPIH